MPLCLSFSGRGHVRVYYKSRAQIRFYRLPE